MTGKHIDFVTLNEYIDKVLPPDQHAAVGQHLAGCTACQRQLAELELLFTTLEELPEVALDRDLSAAVVDAVLDKTRSAQTAPSPLPWPLIWVQVAIACGLFAFVLPFVTPSNLSLSITSLSITGLSMTEWRNTIATALLINVSQPWIYLMDVVTQWLERSQAFFASYRFPEPSFSGVTPLLWIGLLTAASIFWLAGNYWGLSRYELTNNGEGK